MKTKSDMTASILGIATAVALGLAAGAVIAGQAGQKQGDAGGASDAAASEGGVPVTETVISTGYYEPVFRASQWMGAKVVNNEGKSLGEVADLVVDADGLVNYVVVTDGGTLGIAERLTPVPWSRLDNWDAETRVMHMDTDQDNLADAPGFTEDTWPADINGQLWAGEIETYFRITPMTDAGPGAFERQDDNGDHYISRQEAGDSTREAFDRMDDDGDGRLSRAEFSAFEPVGEDTGTRATDQPTESAASGK